MDISQRTIEGPTLLRGGVRITPQAQVFTVRLPFGGVVWNRPSAVLVERDGEVNRLRIVDVGRLAQVAVWACVLIASIAISTRKEARA